MVSAFSTVTEPLCSACSTRQLGRRSSTTICTSTPVSRPASRLRKAVSDTRLPPTRMTLLAMAVVCCDCGPTASHSCCRPAFSLSSRTNCNIDVVTQFTNVSAWQPLSVSDFISNSVCLSCLSLTDARCWEDKLVRLPRRDSGRDWWDGNRKVLCHVQHSQLLLLGTYSLTSSHTIPTTHHILVFAAPGQGGLAGETRTVS